MTRRTKGWVGAVLFVAWAVVFALTNSGCNSGTWSVAGGSNYETSHFDGLWSPDPNGGVGVRVMTDSVVAEETKENVAVGPCVNFSLGTVASSVLDGILPGQWSPLEGAPIEMYGTLALLWETDQKSLVFLPGTEFRLLPGRRVQPTVWVEYLMPEGDSQMEEGVETTFGATYRF